MCWSLFIQSWWSLTSPAWDRQCFPEWRPLKTQNFKIMCDFQLPAHPYTTALLDIWKRKHIEWTLFSPVCVVCSIPAQVSLQWGRSEEPGHKAQSPGEGISCWTHSPTSTTMQKTKGGKYQLQLNIHGNHNSHTFLPSLQQLLVLCLPWRRGTIVPAVAAVNKCTPWAIIQHNKDCPIKILWGVICLFCMLYLVVTT